MDISNFDYSLPKNFIAQSPARPRDSAKLLTIDRKTGQITHYIFHELSNLLTKNDVLIFNQTKVFPARLMGRKKTGGKVEILLLHALGGARWEALTRPGFKMGDKIFFEGFEAIVLARKVYAAVIEFNIHPSKLMEKINIIGLTPIPPYIKSGLPEKTLRTEYQTIYAKTVGSAAAPTAGLHFTESLIAKLRKKGVQMEYVTLHVGLGTFAPVKETQIEKHRIHEEYFEIDESTVERLNQAKLAGKRLIAVGTTTTRLLETCAQDSKLSAKRVTLTKNLKQNNKYPSLLTTNNSQPTTSLFIFPSYKFKFVDSLITNFHLPKSTLLALVSAFVAYPNTKNKFTDFNSSLMGKAYLKAVNNNYRFFSFGDACLIT